MDPSFATAEFGSLAAGLVSQNGDPILRVLAGQLKSDSGDAFIRTYLGTLPAQTRDGVGVPSETEELGGHVVKHFNIPLVTDGYVYADGPTGRRSSSPTSRSVRLRRPSKTGSQRFLTTCAEAGVV